LPNDEALRRQLPGKLLTIAPAQIRYLTRANLANFDLIEVQTYGSARWVRAGDYANLAGGYDRIVFGRNSESDPPDDPTDDARQAMEKGAAGEFAWRVGNEWPRMEPPTFKTTTKIWDLLRVSPSPPGEACAGRAVGRASAPCPRLRGHAAEVAL
jgi:hypothetical protein